MDRDGLAALLPGLGVLVVLGTAARAVGSVTPVSPLVAAIGFGVAVAALVELPEHLEPGLGKYKLLLETGIVLLGAGLTIGQLVETGPLVVGLASVAVLFGVGFGELAGRTAGIERDTRALLSAGASVCGVSAVLAVGRTIDAEESAVTYAAGTVLLFDAVTLVAFPLLGTALGVGGERFGVWAGLSLFSTGPTAAVGFAVSAVSGQWATVTKLVRNTFIGVLAVGYALGYAAGDEDRAGARQIWTRFPKFLVGFVAVAVLANTGALDAAAREAVGIVSDWLFTLAFVGLGIELNPRRLRATGIRPIVVVLAQLLTVTTLAYLAVTLLL